jgi:hypothetical protein
VGEHFSKTWGNRIRSSDGYSIRVLGRTGLEYKDDRVKLRIDSESMPQPWLGVVVYTGSIPDNSELPRAEIIERLQRAFDFAGWRLTLEEAWPKR